MTTERCKRIWIGIAALALLARVLLAFLYQYTSGDYIYFLRHWTEHLVKNGYEHGWADGPWNYSMPYIYLLTGMARVTTHWLIGIKLMSIFFDILMAWGAWRIVDAAMPGYAGWRRWMAAAIMLLLPTFFTNSSLWGQCDAIYVSFVLFSVDALMRRRPARAMVMFGVALAFKLQAIFVVPAMLVLTFKRRIPLWTWVWAVLVYVLTMVPAMVMGRGVVESLNPHYVLAVNNTNSTFAWVPNIWQFMPQRSYNPHILSTVIAVCGVAALVFAFLWGRKIDDKRLDGWGIPMTCFVSVAVVPFLLTGMHERYIALSIALGAVIFVAAPRRLWMCLAPEVLSWPSYLFYLVGEDRLLMMPKSKVGYCCLTLLYLIFLIWLFRIYFANDKKTLETGG